MIWVRQVLSFFFFLSFFLSFLSGEREKNSCPLKSSFFLTPFSTSPPFQFSRRRRMRNEILRQNFKANLFLSFFPSLSLSFLALSVSLFSFSFFLPLSFFLSLLSHSLWIAVHLSFLRAREKKKKVMNLFYKRTNFGLISRRRRNTTASIYESDALSLFLSFFLSFSLLFPFSFVRSFSLLLSVFLFLFLLSFFLSLSSSLLGLKKLESAFLLGWF